MKNNNNPLLCNPETGICELPVGMTETEEIIENKLKKPIKIIYFTDPVCSACWGIEPQLRKMRLEYGNILETEYRMGGLLPDWNYSNGGISSPADVARHWDEVSLYYDMPIDGDVMLEDPVQSSYPPSIAFKAAQMQDEEKAIVFLREMRELLYLKKKNIGKWKYMFQAALSAGLDAEKLKTDFENEAVILFETDLKLSRYLQVRGFPTLFFLDENGNMETICGSRPYAYMEAAIRKLQPGVKKQFYEKTWKSIFNIYPTLSSREYAELTETERCEADATLQSLVDTGQLTRIDCKNGTLWKAVSE